MKKGILLRNMAMWSAVFILSLASSGLSQTYPNKSIDLIVPWAPGGSIESGSRIMKTGMEKYLGQPMVLVTKPGSGGAIGTEYVAKSKPDGYTMLGSSNASNAVAPAVNLNTPYTVDDFIPIGQYGVFNLVLVVNVNSQWKTAKDLIDYGKSNPGKLTYGTGGVGAITFLFAELFKQVTGIKADHVPFKGSGPAVTAVAGGHVDFASSDVVASLSHLDAKRVRALVTSGPKRDPQLPHVPTISEVGFPESTTLVYTAFFVPKGTPKPIVEKLSETFKKVATDPQVGESLKKVGFIPDYEAGEEVQKKLVKEFKIFRELAEKGGFLTK